MVSGALAEDHDSRSSSRLFALKAGSRFGSGGWYLVASVDGSS